MKLLTNLENPCALKKYHCVNCHSHFLAVRPFIKEGVISRRFIKDLKDEQEVESIVNAVLDCSSVDVFELHKFEESLNGNLVFRAKKEGVHLVYCVDKQMRIVFLRAFKNYSEYSKFLEDKREVMTVLSHV